MCLFGFTIEIYHYVGPHECQKQRQLFRKVGYPQNGLVIFEDEAVSFLHIKRSGALAE